jgi:XFP N-terminal domain
MPEVLSRSERSLIDAYWRAANYLSVGQIYLYDNPLLKEPLSEEHIKPRLLGHWGTTPGLNFIYVHLNRLIKKHDLDMIYITGPGHVEDAPAGILAARNAGMAALGVARLGDEALLREAGADLVVTSLDRIDMAALAGGTLSLLPVTEDAPDA